MIRQILIHLFWMSNLALSAGLVSMPVNSHRRLPKTPIQAISLEQTAQGLIEGNQLLVDARPREAYLSGAIPNAISWPAGTKPEPDTLKQMRAAPQIVVYCDGPDCSAGAQLVRDIVKLKFENVYLMKDGYQGWLEAGQPITRTDSP